MARYTPAYSSFIDRLNEVEALRRIALGMERKDPIGLRHEISALCRGAVVLLSSHVEGFVKELGELALDSLFAKCIPRNNIPSQFFYHISKGYIDEVRKTSEPEKIAEKIFSFLQEDYEYWSRIGPFPQSIETDCFNKGFSNPTFKKIKAYFNRFGYSSYRNELASKLQAQFQPVSNMIDHVVDTRNMIAHGDPAASKTPSEIKDMIFMVRIFCAETDTVFASWWKSRFCAIR
jgi:hypothetical protein